MSARPAPELTPLGKELHAEWNGVLVPARTLGKSASITQHCVVPYTSGFQSTVLQGGSGNSYIPLQIQRSQVPAQIENVQVRLKVTNSHSADIQLVHTSKFFDSHEWWHGNRGMFSRAYSTLNWALNYMNASRNQMRSKQKIDNLVPVENNYMLTQHIPAGATVYFYYNATTPELELLQLDPRFVNGDLYLRLYPAQTGICVSSSDNQYITVGQIDLVYTTKRLTDLDTKVSYAHWMKPIPQPCLHPHELKDTATIAASSQYKYIFKNLVGQVPAIMFGLIASDSNVSQGNLRFVDIGDGTTVSLRDPGQRDLLYNGAPIRAEFIQKLAAQKHCINPDFIEARNLYVLPFCQGSIMEAFSGVKKGFQLFDNSGYQLELNTAAAGVTCQHTIDRTNNTAAYFKMSWRGSTSNSIAYNASTSAMATAFNNLFSAQTHPDGPITATFSQNPQSGDVVVTFTSASNPYVQIDEPLQFQWEHTSADGDMYSTSSITRRAQSGFLAGTYTVVIYGLTHGRVAVNKGQIDLHID